jgi:hypothetical protein
MVPGLFWKQTGWIGCVLLVLSVQAVTAAIAYILWQD